MVLAGAVSELIGTGMTRQLHQISTLQPGGPAAGLLLFCGP